MLHFIISLASLSLLFGLNLVLNSKNYYLSINHVFFPPCHFNLFPFFVIYNNFKYHTLIIPLVKISTFETLISDELKKSHFYGTIFTTLESISRIAD